MPRPPDPARLGDPTEAGRTPYQPDPASRRTLLLATLVGLLVGGGTVVALLLLR